MSVVRTLAFLGAGGLLTYALYKWMQKPVAAPGSVLATPLLPAQPTQTGLPIMSPSDLGTGFNIGSDVGSLPVLSPSYSTPDLLTAGNDPSQQLFDPSNFANVPSTYYSDMQIVDPGVTDQVDLSNLDQAPIDVGALTSKNTTPQAVAAVTGGLSPLTQPIQTGATSYSQRLLSWIEGWEHFIPYKYADGAQYSIGYGTRWVAGMPTTITQPQAEQALIGELNSAASQVSAAVTVPLSQNQFDALVSFQFNTGAINRVAPYLNAGDVTGALNDLNKYIKIGTTVSSGLVNRRNAETQMFTNGVYTGP